MATIYVDDTRTGGANNGTSWTDAYLSLDNAGVDGAAAGSEIWVEKGHAETGGGDFTLDFTNAVLATPITIISVDSSDDSYAVATGVTLDINSIVIYGFVRVYGLAFTTTTYLVFCAANDTQYYEDCVLVATTQLSTSSGAEASNSFINCTINSLLTGNAMTVHVESRVRIIGGSVTHTNADYLLVVQDNVDILVSDCDLPDSLYLLETFGPGSRLIKVVVRRCKLKTSFTVGAAMANDASTVLIEGCAVGTITKPELGLTSWDTYLGTVTSVTSERRTGGADDGWQVNEHSWKMVANSNAVEQFRPLVSPPITRVINPDGSPSGTSQGIYTSTRMAIRGTPAALTTDSTSTWSGSGVGTKQKITHTLDSQDGATLTIYVASGGTLNDDDFWIEVSEPNSVGGPITVWFFLAKPSTTVFVDPRLEVA